MSLYFLFLYRHCHYTIYFFPGTVTILLISFQTLSLYFLFLSRHCHYTCYFFPDTVTIILISFQTLTLYFLFDMSYNSSHFHTNSVIFSSISGEKTGRTRCKQTLEGCWRRRKSVHITAIEQVHTDPDQFRHVKHSHSATAKERN